MAQGAIDVHAHLVPRGLLAEAERNPASFGGVEVQRTPEGTVLKFPGMAPLRPIRPPMVDVDQRPVWLQERGMALQIVGPWMDAIGDSLSPDAQRAWSRRFNEELSAMCKERGEKLRGLAALPVQHAESAARELEYAVQRLGLLGAMVGTDVAHLETSPTRRSIHSGVLPPSWAPRSCSTPPTPAQARVSTHEAS